MKRGVLLLIAALLACSGEIEVPVDPIVTEVENLAEPGLREVVRAEILDERLARGEIIVPNNIPNDFPRYPGMSITELDNDSYDQGLFAKFISPGSVDEIGAFYDEAFPKAGWTVSVSRRLSDRKILFADKAGLEVNVDIIEGDPQRIELTLYPHDPNS